MPTSHIRVSAFVEIRRIASGGLTEVAVAAHSELSAHPDVGVLVFDDVTGRPVDLDLRGTEDEVRARYARSAEPTSPPTEAAPRKGPGRPRLGVVSREVTLMPRHWAWLAAQRGGASATLRRLVEDARKSGTRRDEVRGAQDAAFRFMSAMGGDLPGYEEGIRALFAGDAERLSAQLEYWPSDIRDHSLKLAAAAFGPPSRNTEAR